MKEWHLKGKASLRCSSWIQKTPPNNPKDGICFKSSIHHLKGTQQMNGDVPTDEATQWTSLGLFFFLRIS